MTGELRHIGGMYSIYFHVWIKKNIGRLLEHHVLCLQVSRIGILCSASAVWINTQANVDRYLREPHTSHTWCVHGWGTLRVAESYSYCILFVRDNTVHAVTTMGHEWWCTTIKNLLNSNPILGGVWHDSTWMWHPNRTRNQNWFWAQCSRMGFHCDSHERFRCSNQQSKKNSLYTSQKLSYKPLTGQKTS
jgi:hypothetical protein